MMYKKNIFTINYIIVFILILGFYFPKYKVYADSNDRALIIYENEKVFSHNENIVNHLNELLYVFNKEVNKVNINEYESGYIESFSSVFVINIRNDLKNKYLLNDLDNYDNKIYWIGDKIEDLLNHTDKYGISYDGKNNNIVDLIYRDKTLRIKESYLFNIVKHSSSSKILASMSDGYNTYPYIINEKNLYGELIPGIHIKCENQYLDEDKAFYKKGTFRFIGEIVEQFSKINAKNKKYDNKF